MFPKLIIDLYKVKKNAAAAVEAAGPCEVYGVTKGCAGSEKVAAAMLAGGVAGLADSRLPQLEALRGRFPAAALLALRQPMRHEVDRIVDLNATVMISDMNVGLELARAAAGKQRRQKIMLTLEVGDGREGLLPDQIVPVVRTLAENASLEVVGIAANTGCRGGRVPDVGMMEELDRVVVSMETAGLSCPIVSAGNSSCWGLLKAGHLAARANQLRLGELILLGRQPAADKPVNGLEHGAFMVQAEVLEVAVKAGIRQAVLAIGCQDIGAGSLRPVRDGLEMARVTSDHGVARIADGLTVEAGSLIDLIPSYLALQALAASTHVKTTCIGYNNL